MRQGVDERGQARVRPGRGLSLACFVGRLCVGLCVVFCVGVGGAADSSRLWSFETGPEPLRTRIGPPNCVMKMSCAWHFRRALWVAFLFLALVFVLDPCQCTKLLTRQLFGARIFFRHRPWVGVSRRFQDFGEPAGVRPYGGGKNKRGYALPPPGKQAIDQSTRRLCFSFSFVLGQRFPILCRPDQDIAFWVRVIIPMYIYLESALCWVKLFQ